MQQLERYAPLIDEFDAFLEACERPLPTVVRVNTVKTTAERAVAALERSGVTVTQRSWRETVLELDTGSPGLSWPYAHGWLTGQEEVSAIPPIVLDPQPGERVFAACAAPGSKATQIGALMDDRGTLLANDDTLGRLSALRSNADRLGLTCLGVTNRDARNYSLEAFEFDAVDRALVDVPCTCEGTIRKNPDVLDAITDSYRDSICTVQSGILRRAVELTRPGGTVVYSTCTFAPEENEAVLDSVLNVRDCTLVPFDCGLDSVPGLTEWQGETFDSTLTRAKRFYPQLNDTGGFFCAKLEVGA